MASSNGTCPMPASSGAEVPFIPLIAGLTTWPLIKMVFEAVVARLAPGFYLGLTMDVRKKYEVYFGTWMGIFFKPISLIACSAALLATPAATDVIGFVRPLSVAEQWCWGCRAVIYLQEMPHYAAMPELLIHHTLSVFSMLAVLWYNIPRRQLYLIWVGLLSELFNNARRLLKMHGKLTPHVSWWISFCMAWSNLFFRVLGCFIALLWTMQGGAEGVVLLVNGGCLLFYFLYLIKLTMFELSQTKMMVIDLARPAKIVLGEMYEFSLFSAALGLGLVCAEVSTLFMYHANSGTASSELELRGISWAVLQSVITGLGVTWLAATVSRTSRINTTASSAGSSLGLQGALVFAAATIFLNPNLPGHIDKAALFACMVLSAPLYKTFSHFGVYYASSGLGLRAAPRGSEDTTDLEKDGDSEGKNKAMDEKPQGDSPTAQDSSQNYEATGVGDQPSPASTLKHFQPEIFEQVIPGILNGILYCTTVLARWVLGIQLYEAAAISAATQGFIKLNTGHVTRGISIDGRSLLRTNISLHSLLSLVQTLLGAGSIMAISKNNHLVGYSEPLSKAYAVMVAFGVVYAATQLIEWCLSRKTYSHMGHQKTANGKWPRRLLTLRNAGLLSAMVIMAIIAVATWMGYAPEELSSWDAVRSQRKAHHEVPWQFASSCHFAVPTMGIALAPILMAYILGLTK